MHPMMHTGMGMAPFFKVFKASLVYGYASTQVYTSDLLNPGVYGPSADLV